jgi:5-(carboxyamino)imidazole ribonucleotide synthase
VIAGRADLDAVPADLLPGILKTTRMGYDGKGQRRVATQAELEQAWSALGAVTCVLEQRVALAYELSVIVARGADGQIVSLPPQQNLHRDGILAVTLAPGPDIDAETAARALRWASAIASTLSYVGVLCIEFFVLTDGTLLANEMAPRPHNSGHYSIDACDLSQFALQVRAMAGLPLLQPRLHSPAVMLNLLGDLWRPAGGRVVEPPWDQVLRLPGAHLHLYGKAQALPGRKMGHLTLTAATLAEAQATASEAASLLGLPPL